jgi:hypothetical protein
MDKRRKFSGRNGRILGCGRQVVPASWFWLLLGRSDLDVGRGSQGPRFPQQHRVRVGLPSPRNQTPSRKFHQRAPCQAWLFILARIVPFNCNSLSMSKIRPASQQGGLHCGGHDALHRLPIFVDMEAISTAMMGDIGRGGHEDVDFEGEWAQCLGLVTPVGSLATRWPWDSTGSLAPAYLAKQRTEPSPRPSIQSSPGLLSLSDFNLHHLQCLLLSSLSLPLGAKASMPSGTFSMRNRRESDTRHGTGSCQ